MGDIFSFLDEYGGFTFVEKPMCDIDGLIMSHMSYYLYDGIVPGPQENRAPVYLGELPGLMDRQNFISVRWEEEKNRDIFEKITTSRRYRNARACCYVSELDDTRDLQFGAITFMLGNGDVFISFRGTDDNLVGWREDFNMAYCPPVEAQLRSVSYVEQVNSFFAKKKDVRYYFGGHSKGGNLALYAAMNCSSAVRGRIGRIFDMDGPGFRPDFLNEEDYEAVREKITKIVPKESFFGMLMEPRKDFILIESVNIGVKQHVIFSWLIEGDSFVIAPTQVHERQTLYESINNWIFGLDKEQVGSFIDSLFKLVEITEATTLSELKKVTPDFSKKARSIREEYRKMSPETKVIFWEMTVFVAEVVAKDQQESIRKWRILERLRERMEKAV